MKHQWLIAACMSFTITTAMAATCTRMGDTTYCDDEHGHTRVLGGYGDTHYVEAEGPGYSRKTTITRYGDTVHADRRDDDNHSLATYGGYGDTFYDDDDDDLSW